MSVDPVEEYVAIHCDCRAPEHTILFQYSKGTDEHPAELYCCVQMTQPNGFFRRCWYAIKYVFGKSPTRGHWDEVIMSGQNTAKLHQYLELVMDYNLEEKIRKVNFGKQSVLFGNEDDVPN